MIESPGRLLFNRRVGLCGRADKRLSLIHIWDTGCIDELLLKVMCAPVKKV